MRIYHYGFKEKIITEGIDTEFKHKDTQAINKLIYEIYGDYLNKC